MLVDPSEQCANAASILYEVAGSGVATGFKLSGWRSMTIDEFKEQVVPTLKSSPAENKFHYYVLRDLSNDRYLTIYPDGVMDYKVEEVVEANAASVIERLRTAEEENIRETILNTSLPVWGFRDGTTWSLSVKIPETRFLFRNRLLFQSEDNYPRIWMPPVIFKVIGRENSILTRYVWLLMQDSVNKDFVKYTRLPMPNVFVDGKICVGRTATLSESDSNLSRMQLIMQAWDLFINSEWNFDLLNTDLFPSNLEVIYEKYKDPESSIVKKVDGVRNNAEKKLLMFLEILREPGRWEDLNWISII